MKEFSVLLFLLIFTSINANLLKVYDFQPQQVHIAFGGLYSYILFSRSFIK